MHFHQRVAVVDGGNAQDASALAGGFRGVFEQVGEDAFHQILVGQRGGMAVVKAQIVGQLGVAALQERHAFFEQCVQIQRHGQHGRLGGELREGADAALQALHLLHHDLGGALQAPGHVVEGAHGAADLVVAACLYPRG